MDDTELPNRVFVMRGRLILGLIGLMAAIHAVRVSLSPEGWVETLLTFAFVPASWTRLVDPAAVEGAAAATFGRGAGTVEALQTLFALRPWTPITHAFLHGDWMHLIVNSVWLAAFGSAVARRFGAWRFALFFCATAIGGALAHLATHSLSFGPLVGVSPVVSGAMAAAARFAFAPGAPLGGSGQNGTLQAYQRPPVRLRDLLRERRAFTFLALWFVSNILFGAFTTPIGVADASIAWQAHIGGFLVGLLMFPLFDPVPPQPSPSEPARWVSPP